MQLAKHPYMPQQKNARHRSARHEEGLAMRA
jgi:hypothetical protein